MLDCSVCDSQLPELFQNTEYGFLLCGYCYEKIRKIKKHRNYVRISIMGSNLSSSVEESNNQAKILIKESHYGKDQILAKGWLEALFEQRKNVKESSQTLTISTRDSDFFRESVEEPSSKLSKIKQRCGEQVQKLLVKVQPMKQKIQIAKNNLISSSLTFKNKLLYVKDNYDNLKAQMPPLRDFAVNSMKIGFKSLFKKIF